MNCDWSGLAPFITASSAALAAFAFVFGLAKSRLSGGETPETRSSKNATNAALTWAALAIVALTMAVLLGPAAISPWAGDCAPSWSDWTQNRRGTALVPIVGLMFIMWCAFFIACSIQAGLFVRRRGRRRQSESKNGPTTLAEDR